MPLSPIMWRVRTVPSFLLLATAIAAIGGGCVAYGWSRSPGLVRIPDASTVESTPQPPVATLPPRVAPAHPQAARPASAATSADRMAAQVDRLSRSSNPVDVFGAYKLVTDCLWARGHESWLANHVAPGDRAQLPSTGSSCDDIASDQIQSRMRWLELAAMAGVHHAATAMAREGPDGLGQASEADLDAPQFADWRQRLDAAYDAGVRTCDPESLDNRVNAYENGAGVGQDRAKALTYWVAYVDCRKRLNDAPSTILGNGDSVTQRMGGSLSADQIARAVSAGQQMARDAKPLPGDS